jgi:hypothetical protein
MSAYDEHRLADLLRALPPAPEAWVRAAQELPRLASTVQQILARAEADELFRHALTADLEAMLVQEGYEPDRNLVDALQRELRRPRANDDGTAEQRP